MLYTSNLETVRKAAQKLIAGNETKAYVLYVYGRGYIPVTSDFYLDRNYFHSSEGEKMFFDLYETIDINGNITKPK